MHTEKNVHSFVLYCSKKNVALATIPGFLCDGSDCISISVMSTHKQHKI